MLEPTETSPKTEQPKPLEILSGLVRAGQTDKIKEFFQNTQMTSKELLSWNIDEEIRKEDVHGSKRIHNDFRAITLTGNFGPIIALMSATIFDDQVMNDLIKYVLLEAISENITEAVSAILDHQKLTTEIFMKWLPEMFREAYRKHYDSLIIKILHHEKCTRGTIPTTLATESGIMNVELKNDSSGQLKIEFHNATSPVVSTTDVSRIFSRVVSVALISAIRTHSLSTKYWPKPLAANEVESIQTLLIHLDSKREIPFYKVLQEKDASGVSLASILNKQYRTLVEAHPRLLVVMQLVLYMEKSQKWLTNLHHTTFVNELMKANLPLAEMNSKVDLYLTKTSVTPNGDMAQISKIMKSALNVGQSASSSESTSLPVLKEEETTTLPQPQ